MERMIICGAVFRCCCCCCWCEWWWWDRSVRFTDELVDRPQRCLNLFPEGTVLRTRCRRRRMDWCRTHPERDDPLMEVSLRLEMERLLLCEEKTNETSLLQAMLTDSPSPPFLKPVSYTHLRAHETRH